MSLRGFVTASLNGLELNLSTRLPINRMSPESKPMIQLTRLNKQPLSLNSDLIKFIEYAPDTVITLLNGEKIVVLETGEQILERIIEFRRRLISGLNINPTAWTQAGGERSESPPQSPPPERS